jgi:lipopolysaccharide export system protein LptA
MIDRKLLGLLLIVAMPAWALKTDRDQDMTVNADQSTSNADRTELTGNVKIDQGSLKIRAGHAIVDQQDGDISRVIFDGAPATLQQEVENQGLMRAEALNIEYLLAEDKVVLSGKVRIERPRGTMNSERVVYHVKTGLLDAGNQAGGVTMTIKPKPKPAGT